MDKPKIRTAQVVMVALVAAAGVGVKPLIVPIVRGIALSLGLPAGSVAGGLYMFWLVLGNMATGLRWGAAYVGMVQAALAAVWGTPGPQGLWMFLMYVTPGVAADLVLWGPRSMALAPPAWRGAAAGAAANMTGTVLMASLFYRMPAAVVVVAGVSGAVSGAGGGLLAVIILRRVTKIAGPLDGGQCR